MHKHKGETFVVPSLRVMFKLQISASNAQTPKITKSIG